MLIIVRGMPGSGKSTIAKMLKDKHKDKPSRICSTDNYFMQHGVYRFDPSKLGQYHTANYNDAASFVEVFDNTCLCIIDNTNVAFRDFEQYCEAAVDNGHTVSFAEPGTPWKFNLEELVKHNTHNVPKQAIARMISKWQPKEEVVRLFEIRYGYTPEYLTV